MGVVMAVAVSVVVGVAQANTVEVAMAGAATVVAVVLMAPTVMAATVMAATVVALEGYAAGSMGRVGESASVVMAMAAAEVPMAPATMMAVHAATVWVG